MFKTALLAAAITLLSTASYSHVYRTTTYKIVRRPQQQCWTETAHARHRNYTGAIVGGVAGGLLGSTIGSGNGRVAATALGAGTGAIVGDRVAKNHQPHTVQHCRTVMRRVRVPIHARAAHYLQQ